MRYAEEAFRALRESLYLLTVSLHHAGYDSGDVERITLTFPTLQTLYRFTDAIREGATYETVGHQPHEWARDEQAFIYCDMELHGLKLRLQTSERTQGYPVHSEPRL